jgi:hypothetical protein
VAGLPQEPGAGHADDTGTEDKDPHGSVRGFFLVRDTGF